MQEGTLENTDALKDTQTTAILIANPTAGSYTQHENEISNTISFMRSHGWQAELKLTQKAGDARHLTQEAVKQGINVVVAIGGDGTVNEVIQELAGSETALGVIPSGTVNVWAREVGIPLDFSGARDVLISGQTRRIDLGKINDDYFLLMVGIGIDGEVAHAVEKKTAKRFGVLGYLFVGTWLGLGYPAFRAVLQTDDHATTTNAIQIIIGNTQLYAGAIKYTWQAKCDDGLLDVCIVRKQSMLGRIAVGITFLLRRKEREHWIRYETGATIKLHTRKPVAIQIDGDPKGYTFHGPLPTTISVAPDALKVIVPENVPPELFSK
ncbi:MAG: diacylglycerol kinase family lipid kinase [Ktedonobacteraceae bacterium]|nr:diacylglycerol kinase family lipid kinase [Ktedonobacteraceae bacterium]